MSSYDYNGNPLTFYEAVYVQFTLKWTVNAQFTYKRQRCSIYAIRGSIVQFTLKDAA